MPPLRPDELMHYGIPRRSGRYPYGSGDRPYQSTGEKHGLSGYFQRKKQKKEQEKILEKERHDANKGNVLQRGSATQVLKYKGELTNEELSRVIRRLELEGKLKEYSSKEVTTSMQKIDEMMKNMKTITNWANIGTDSYNTFASIYNATEAGKKKPMTFVQKANQNVDKKDKKKK